MANNLVLFVDPNGNTLSYDPSGNDIFDVVNNIVIPANLTCNIINANTANIHIIAVGNIAVNNLNSNNIVTVVLNSNTVNVSSNTLTLGTSNISANGYSWMPNGLLMQWGHGSATTGVTTNFNYNVVYPANAFSISISDLSGILSVGIVNNSVFSINNPDAFDRPFTWIAIGH